MDQRVLNEKQAAHYLNISPNTLRQQRYEGQRENHLPFVPFFKMGRKICYLREELDKFIDKIIEDQLAAQQ